MKKVLSIFTAIAIVCFIFAGCAAPTASKSTAASGNAGSATETFSAAAEATSAAADNKTADNPTGVEASTGKTAATTPDSARKLVYTAEYSITSDQYTTAYGKLISSINSSGGYISSENTTGTAPKTVSDPGRVSVISARIPVDKYSAFLSSIEGIGTVTSKSQNTEDISSNYYDTESRIQLLQDHYDRLAEHLKSAVKMSDVIELEQEMSDILDQLDQLKGDKRHMDNLVAMCTVNVTLTEIAKTTNVTGETNGSVSDRASESFASAMSGMGKFFEESYIGFMSVLPALLVLIGVAAITLAIIFGIRAARKKHKKQKKAPAPAVDPSRFNAPPSNGENNDKK